MKRVFFIQIIIGLTFLACKSPAKMQAVGGCSFTQSYMAYGTVNDSVFSLQLQQLGKFYFNFILETCKKIDRHKLELTGYISFPDPGNEISNQKRIADVHIVQAARLDKFTLGFKQSLGKTDSTGRFDIVIDVGGEESFLLFGKQGFNQITVQLSFK
ncbi:hypothetical protein [Ferruginibacter sp.]